MSRVVAARSQVDVCLDNLEGMVSDVAIIGDLLVTLNRDGAPVKGELAGWLGGQLQTLCDRIGDEVVGVRREAAR